MMQVKNIDTDDRDNSRTSVLAITRIEGGGSKAVKRSTTVRPKTKNLQADNLTDRQNEKTNKQINKHI